MHTYIPLTKRANQAKYTFCGRLRPDQAGRQASNKTGIRYTIVYVFNAKTYLILKKGMVRNRRTQIYDEATMKETMNKNEYVALFEFYFLLLLLLLVLLLLLLHTYI